MADETIELIIGASDKASGVLSKVGGSIGKLAGPIGAVTAAAAAMGAALFKVTKEGADFQDMMLRASQRANMGVTAFSGLAHAADLAGIGVDQLQSVLSRMNRAISEASYGVRAYKDEFDKLGISVRTAEGALKTSDQVLADLADQIQKNGVNADVMAAGMKVVGRNFAQMLPMLQEGSAGLRAAAADARYLGIELGERGARQADYFNDSLQRLGLAFKGISVAVSNETMPVLTGLIRIATDWVVKSRETIVDWAKTFINGAITVWAYFEQAFSNIKKILTLSFGLDDIKKWVEGMLASFMQVFQATLIWAQNVGRVIVTAFQIAWQTFAELGKWGFQKVFDFVSGQDLAGDLESVLRERIPEATAEGRMRMEQEWAALGAASVNVGATVAKSLMTAFGLSAEEAKRRADKITAELTRIGAVASDESKKITDVEAENNLKRLEKQKIALEKRLAVSAEGYVLENEQIALDYALKQTNLAIAREQEVITQQEYDARMQQLALTHKARMGDIWAQGQLANQKLTQKSWSEQAQYITGQLEAITSGMAEKNKTMFKVNKAAAIANAIVNTYMAATKALAEYGFPLGVVFAALTVAAGLAQVSKIKSQNFGGQAHAGLTNVPSEGTYLLDKGERVVQPEQNRDLSEFLGRENSRVDAAQGDGSGGGGAPVINNIAVHMFENVTTADALLTMPKHEIERVVADKIIPAFSSLGRIGIKPDYLEAYAT